MFSLKKSHNKFASDKAIFTQKEHFLSSITEHNEWGGLGQGWGAAKELQATNTLNPQSPRLDQQSRDPFDYLMQTKTCLCKAHMHTSLHRPHAGPPPSMGRSPAAQYTCHSLTCFHIQVSKTASSPKLYMPLISQIWFYWFLFGCCDQIPWPKAT